MIPRAMLPDVRKEPATKCYLVCHSLKYNRKMVHGHYPGNTHTAVEGGKCLAIVIAIKMLVKHSWSRQPW